MAYIRNRAESFTKVYFDKFKARYLSWEGRSSITLKINKKIHAAQYIFITFEHTHSSHFICVLTPIRNALKSRSKVRLCWMAKVDFIALKSWKFSLLRNHTRQLLKRHKQGAHVPHLMHSDTPMNRCLNTTHVASRWRAFIEQRELVGIISAERDEYCWQNIKEEDDFLPPDLSLETRCTPDKTPRSSSISSLNAFLYVRLLLRMCSSHCAPSVYPHPLFYLLFCIIHIMERYAVSPAARRPPCENTASFAPLQNFWWRHSI